MKQPLNNEFQAFVKRLQSALKRRKIIVSVSDIRETIASVIDSHDNELTESVQQECLNLLLDKYQLDTLALVEDEGAPRQGSELVKGESELQQQSEQQDPAMFLEQIDAIVIQATQQLGTEFVNANKASIVQFVQQVTKEYATTEKLLKAVINHFQEKKANLYTELSQQIKDDSEQIRSEVDNFFREQRQQRINDYQAFFNSLNINLDVTEILSA